MSREQQTDANDVDDVDAHIMVVGTFSSKMCSQMCVSHPHSDIEYCLISHSRSYDSFTDTGIVAGNHLGANLPILETVDYISPEC
ncbi:hypothetical protein RDWZM_003444 [Blomia tropicalis]|uniref:Uncharacterized protein n=1 Tax=Blomia tropicalis TaxID=40697 RepID=A0A9Q0MG29_BLOTA|nr:hypothetical protein RDWZM_003444 [Blomia tropicalis]